MISAHYPLQALLYSAALHRYLRWRLPGYDPEKHLGGVLYLFLRGMAGPDTPTQDGIAVRGVQLAAAPGAGRRAVRPAGRPVGAMRTASASSVADPSGPRPAPARSTPRASSASPTSRSPPR